MSVRFTLGKASTDALTTVSAAASTVTRGITAVDFLMGTLAAQAEDYRIATERDLAASRTQRQIRRANERAREDALFHDELAAELEKNPRLMYFDQALAAYEKADAEVTERLKLVS